MSATEPRSFAIYWRSEPRQLFSFRQHVAACSPHEARELFRRAAHPRRRPIVIGVKALAPCGRRCSHRGHWLA